MGLAPEPRLSPILYSSVHSFIYQTCSPGLVLRIGWKRGHIPQSSAPKSEPGMMSRNQPAKKAGIGWGWGGRRRGYSRQRKQQL